MEVEIREAPRLYPVSTPPGLLPGGATTGRYHGAGGWATGSNSTATYGNATAGDLSALDGFFADPASLSPESLFRSYLEREREGGRNVSAEVGKAKTMLTLTWDQADG